ncbi:hypothetical protein VaNZ11_007392 [Volvox africanus]|uniref:Reverse transcriptase domain-containing protein n=1 Tax=Volvox africanus TaxID=51714 RepID=A0ABQ5S2S4_9CHLO|nr:hypothetical protein VaNZ11_007392 [Volvox africanus]
MNIAQKAYNCLYKSLCMLRWMGIQGSWMVKVDLVDAFYHIPICAANHYFFVFRFCGVLYQVNALPMGWLSSPYWFSNIMHNMMHFWCNPLAAVGGRCRRLAPPLLPHRFYPPARCGRPVQLGLRVLPYLDDFFVCVCFGGAGPCRGPVGQREH